MISYSESCFYFSMFSWVYISDTSTDCCHLRCTTSARLIFCGTYHFCTGLWSIASHYWNRGVPLESSGLRFSSGRSMNIRLFLKIYRWAPAAFVSLLGEYPMLLFHGPLNSNYKIWSLLYRASAVIQKYFMRFLFVGIFVVFNMDHFCDCFQKWCFSNENNENRKWVEIVEKIFLGLKYIWSGNSRLSFVA